jgi:hypothetical protein
VRPTKPCQLPQTPACGNPRKEKKEEEHEKEYKKKGKKEKWGTARRWGRSSCMPCGAVHALVSKGRPLIGGSACRTRVCPAATGSAVTVHSDVACQALASSVADTTPTRPLHHYHEPQPRKEKKEKKGEKEGKKEKKEHKKNEKKEHKKNEKKEKKEKKEHKWACQSKGLNGGIDPGCFALLPMPACLITLPAYPLLLSCRKEEKEYKKKEGKKEKKEGKKEKKEKWVGIWGEEGWACHSACLGAGASSPLLPAAAQATRRAGARLRLVVVGPTSWTV